ncbi:hypothetical protein BV898_09210 [Hypsibius exemplaris]|uniref:Receptor ligand binding region domain-containing protein n=1 Tax=Hypsibius exemplaris TaxID=2072580 RepID=A0A1W0WNE2_HYPEX|nr:hypothetical protein BV898_09210 [Hypsibius exemplaris]
MSSRDSCRCMLYLIIFPFLHDSPHQAGASAVLDVEIASLLPSTGQLSLALNAPAYDVALAEIQRNYGDKFKFSITYLTDRTTGSCLDLQANADLLISRWYYTTRRKTAISVIILPGCISDSTVHMLVSIWNILIIYSADPPQMMGNRQLSLTTISTAYISIPTFVTACHNLMDKYAWKSVFLLYDTNSAPLNGAMASYFKAASDKIIGQSTVYVTFSSAKNESLTRVLRQFHNVSRVLIFLGHAAQLRQLLEAQVAFESLIVIQPEASHAPWSRHAMELGRILRQRSVTEYNYTAPLDIQPDQIILGCYLAVIIFGQVLNEALEEGANVFDGTEMAKRFLERQFPNDLSGIYICSNGDRLPTLIISQFAIDDPKGCSSSDALKAIFRQNSNDTTKLVELHQIMWPFSTPWPPPNEPICGYRDENETCTAHVVNFSITAIIAAAISVVAICALASLIRMLRTALNTGWLLDQRELTNQTTINPTWSVTAITYPARRRDSQST